MPIYKTLFSFPDKSGRPIFDGSVASGWELWNSLDAALNDLGASNWEVQCPLYGTRATGDNSITWPVALILVNRSLDASQEIERQAKKLQKEIAESRAELETATDAKEKDRISLNIKNSQERLDGLREKSNR